MNVEIHDQGYVFVNDRFVGVISRGIDSFELTIYGKPGDSLKIIVESQGRVTVGPYLKDFKVSYIPIHFIL